MDGGHVDLLVEFGGRVRVVHVIAVRDVLHAQIEQPWGPAEGGWLRGHPETLPSPGPEMPDAGQPEQQGGQGQAVGAPWGRSRMPGCFP